MLLVQRGSASSPETSADLPFVQEVCHGSTIYGPHEPSIHIPLCTVVDLSMALTTVNFWAAVCLLVSGMGTKLKYNTNNQATKQVSKIAFIQSFSSSGIIKYLALNRVDLHYGE